MNDWVKVEKQFLKELFMIFFENILILLPAILGVSLERELSTRYKKGILKYVLDWSETKLMGHEIFTVNFVEP